MRNRALPVVFGVLLLILIGFGIIYSQKNKNPAESSSAPAAQTVPASGTGPSTQPSVAATGTGSPAPAGSQTPVAVDLNVDANGLSHSTVVMQTTKGTIKFKFYSKDAPNTVARLTELIQKSFYNGLSFHRVVPDFVVQGGDPLGNGTGGSGVKLKAEFNDRHHLEGTVAMARAQDPDSADSQFYICLAPQPRLDHLYTVVGQVIDGMDVVRKIQVGDKMTSVVIQ